MNRLTPLIARHPKQASRPLFQWDEPAEEVDSKGFQDLKLFAMGWLGGLVFFGTLLS